MSSRKRISVHQPNFLPRLKVLQKLAYSDVWVVLDSVQYCAREWQNRARIVSFRGSYKHFWLTIPVHRPNGQKTFIKDVEIINPAYSAKLIKKSFWHAFRNAPYWQTINKYIHEISPYLEVDSLTQLCVETTRALLHIVGKEPTIIFSSSLPVSGKGSALMAEICKHLKMSIYLSDSGGHNYMLPEHFKDILVLWQNWHEPFERCESISSWRNISSINYLARYGPKQFRNHILNGEFKQDPEFNRK